MSIRVKIKKGVEMNSNKQNNSSGTKVPMKLIALIAISIMTCCIICAVIYRTYKKSSPEDMAKIAVVNDIKVQLGDKVSPSFKLVTISKPDSAYGVYYFSPSEMSKINDLFLSGSMTACDKMTSALAGADKKATNADFEYFKEVAPKYQAASSILSSPKDSSSFSGWKVKSIYQYTNQKGVEMKVLRYTFLSTDYKKVLGKLDIPYPKESPSVTDK